MTAPAPGTGYLASPEARSLQATFIANVDARMRELGWVYVGGAANDGPAGKLALKKLADESGVPPRTIENLMRNGNQPSLVGAAAVAAALGVRLDTLLGQEGDFGPSVDSSGNGQLTCIHTSAHLAAVPVCADCLGAWQRFQAKKRTLWEASRVQATADADARMDQHKARVAANGMDPNNVKR